MCFLHVLLNLMDAHQKGMEACLIFEGASVTLLEELETKQVPLYIKAKELGLIEGICKACSASLGVLDYNESVGLPLLDEVNGHPSMASYRQKGYEIICL